MDVDNRYGTLAVQQSLLELLKEFHSFCKKNGVKYSLAYGSLLGAIRHNGFIPWDDDLDVFVDRANYNLLIEKMAEDQHLMVDDCSVQSLWVDRVRRRVDMEDYTQGFVPTLDVLVLDTVPANAFARKLKLFRILTLQGMMKPKLSLDKGSFFLKICSLGTFIIGKLFSNQWKHRRYRSVSQMGTPSAYVANYNGEYSDLCRIYPVSMMDHLVEHQFEDTQAMIVADYDQCLTTQFGDYMTPPPEQERIPRHGGA